MLSVLFVYGTLKRGEINHELVAPYLLSIEPASIRGTLYDAGDFPALTEGDSIVHGELIRLDPTATDHVIEIVDRLEGYIPDRDELSLYHRRTVTAMTEDGREEAAYSYFYNPSHGALPPLALLTPIESGRWAAPDNPLPPTTMESFEEYRDWVRTFRRSGTPVE